MTRDEFKALYEAKGNEDIYITLTNLAKIRAALDILNETFLLDEDPFISEDERRKIITKLIIWRDNISNAITDGDDYLLGEDGESLDYDDVD